MKGNKYVKQIHGLLTVFKKETFFFFLSLPQIKGVTGQTMMGKTNWKNKTSNLVIHIYFFFYLFRIAVMMTLQLLEYLTFMLFKKPCVVLAFPNVGQ